MIVMMMMMMTFPVINSSVVHLSNITTRLILPCRSGTDLNISLLYSIAVLLLFLLSVAVAYTATSLGCHLGRAVKT